MKWTCLFICFVVCATTGCGRASRSQNGSEDEASFADLNRAVALYDTIYGSYPKNVSKLTNIATLRGKKLPLAPAGERLAINPSNHQVVFISDSKMN